MQRTCRMLVGRGLAEWPDGGGDGMAVAAAAAAAGCGVGGAYTAAPAAAATATITVEAALPGGGVARTVRDAASKVALRSPGRGGMSPKVPLPRLTPAGRLAWMQTRLGVNPKESIVLALAWGRFKSAGYFVKSRDWIRENVWMSEWDITRCYNMLSRKGYIDENKKTGEMLRVRRAGRVEPYGPMLGVVEDMVYGAREGEYVYGNAYDDAINAAYAETKAALAEAVKRREAAREAGGAKSGGSPAGGR